jgi:hypothetical protein
LVATSVSFVLWRRKFEMASNSVSNKRKKDEAKKHAEGASERSRAGVPDESQRDYGSLGDEAHGMSHLVERGTSQVRELTRDHETGAVIMAAVAGFGVGVLIGAALAHSHRKPETWRDRIMAEGMGHRLMERMESMLPEAIAQHLGR